MCLLHAGVRRCPVLRDLSTQLSILLLSVAGRSKTTPNVPWIQRLSALAAVAARDDAAAMEPDRLFVMLDPVTDQIVSVCEGPTKRAAALA